MSGQVRRLRMIAGPNGSGKSTAVLHFLEPEWLGHYINPDDMQKSIARKRFFSFHGLGIKTSLEEVVGYLRTSTFPKPRNFAEQLAKLSFEGRKLVFGTVVDDAAFGYFVPLLADFIRSKLIEKGSSFTFETVMSHESKVELLKHARENGYRTYLYFVATEDPELNVERVRLRVLQKGHAVDEGRIRHRYKRSLELLMEAIRNSNRAFIFDNSGDHARFIAEITEETDPSKGRTVDLKVDEVPAWFQKAVLDQL